MTGHHQGVKKHVFENCFWFFLRVNSSSTDREEDKLEQPINPAAQHQAEANEM